MNLFFLKFGPIKDRNQIIKAFAEGFWGRKSTEGDCRDLL